MFNSAIQALRTTPLRLMVLAQALAIAAQLSVLLTADRYQQLFKLEAAALMGGDMVVNADRLPSAQLEAKILGAGLALAKTTQFNSVVLSADKQTLVSAKAVDSAYPLRGKISFKGVLNNQTAQTNELAAGHVWVDEAVLKNLGLALGDTLSLGERQFLISAVIDIEPDRGLQFIGFAPRVMLAQVDLDSTQLLGSGSRAVYRWQISGPPAKLDAFKRAFNAAPVAGQRLETLDEGRPEMRGTLDRASRFLGLIAILTTLIAACGLGLVAHIWAKEQAQTVALMRTLGASTRQVAARLLAQLGWASALGLSLGVSVGYAFHAVLAVWLTSAEGVRLPAAGYTPLMQAVLLLIVLLLACVSAPVQQLIHTQPIHVLRGQLSVVSNRWRQWLSYAVAALCLAALVIWVAGTVKLGAIVLSALVGVVVLVALVVKVLTHLALAYGRQHNAWFVRTAARGLLRNTLLTTVQATTLALALLGVLMLWILQRDVLGAWQAVLPKNAPNHFVFNIQPDQAAEVKNAILSLGVQAATLQPMVRARLVKINETPVDLDSYDDERAKNLINREFNMSYGAVVPDGNTLTAGQWHGNAPGEISMETGIIKTLGLKLGDSLQFDVAGQMLSLKLSSVRKLKWESLNVNFFAIASADSAKSLPQTFIAAVYVPPNVELARLARLFPNLTVLDVGVIAAQGRTVLDKVSRALQLLFALGLVAGGLVIAIIAYASRLARLRETAILRVLGASQSQVRAAHLLEQACIGLLAGFIAGLASYSAVQSLASVVLELPITLGFWPIGLGALLGALVNVVGYFALQRDWKPTPLGTQVRALGL